MFRASPWSSSGGQIVLIQHLVQYSQEVTVRYAGAHQMVTYWEYYTRCCINTIRPPDDDHGGARNM